jgi:phosphoglycerol transferase MdoB-like AlkP superfamily enzyme
MTMISERYRGKKLREILADGWPERRRSMVIRASFLAVYLVLIVRFLADPANYAAGDGPDVRQAVLLTAGMAVMSIVAVLPNMLSERANRLFLALGVLLIPGLIVCALALPFGTNLLDVRKSFLGVNVVMVYLLCLTGAIVTGRIRTGLFAGAGLACAFGAISYYVNLMRGSPLLFSDLTNFGTGFKMLGEFDYRMDRGGLLFTIAIFSIFVVISKLPLNRPFGKKTRVAFALLFCVGWSGIVYATVFADSGLFRKVANSFTHDPLRKGYNKNGALLAFMRSARLSVVVKPEGYSPQAVRELVAGIDEKTAAEYPGKASGEYARPNVIAVMNESFTDIANIGEHIETNVDPLPFWHGLKEDAIKGYAYVSGFGGGTANSEYEFLTGNTMAFLPINASPYQIYMKHEQPSLVSTLKAQGYAGNIAVHPFRKNGYSRERAYELLGFSEFLDQDDFTEPRRVRNFISDEADYDKLIALYEENKARSDDPVFLWTVTMQNHGPFAEQYDNFSADVHAEGLTPEEQGEYGEVDILLSLMHESDRAIGELVEYFRQVDEPTVVVFFGDHQPNLPQAYLNRVLNAQGWDISIENFMKKYRVPFFIWANFDIEERTIDRISLNYLSSVMMDAAGMEMTDYNKYLLDLMKEVPCLTVYGHYDADGNFYNTEDKVQNDPALDEGVIKANAESSPQDKLLNEYDMIAYNNLFDWRNRVNDFFSLDGTK